MEYLTRRVGEFTNLHLEWNVPDVVQTKRHQAALYEAVDTERHNRVLVSSPLGEGLNSRTDWRPDKGQHHAHKDRRQTGDDRHETFTSEEAQILRQLNTVETVEHVGCNSTGDDTAQHAGIGEVLGCDLFCRQMQDQRCNHRHGFHHDAVSNHSGQRGNAVVIGEAQRNADCEDKRHVGENRTARFRHNMRNHFWQPAEVCRTDAQQDTCDRQYGYWQHQRFTHLLQVSKCVLKHNRECS